MAEHQRIDDLRRRVQQDPASIAFAQLAEELRRAGRLQEAVDTCRAGLMIHPTYLSARVTLGRALLELDKLDDAERELDFVARHAPENRGAVRGLGDICRRRGDLGAALAHYRRALALTQYDPDLDHTVAELAQQLGQPVAAVPNERRAPAAATPAQDAERRRAEHTIAALEQWLEAIHVARADRSA
jgi:tetratricopeptide (TPR) repeat protein